MEHCLPWELFLRDEKDTISQSEGTFYLLEKRGLRKCSETRRIRDTSSAFSVAFELFRGTRQHEIFLFRFYYALAVSLHCFASETKNCGATSQSTNEVTQERDCFAQRI